MTPATDWTLGVPVAQPWSLQSTVLDAIRDHRFVGMPACHGVGATWTAALAAARWVMTRPAGFVVLLSPSPAQLRDQLIRQIRAFDLGGSWRNNGWTIDGEFRAVGFSSATHRDSLAGLHCAETLVVIDDSGYLPQHLWDLAHAVTTSRVARILAVGRPGRVDGPFGRLCVPDDRFGVPVSAWDRVVVPVNAWDSPNFTGEDVTPELAENLIGPDWVTDRITQWGAGSPMTSELIMGRFRKPVTTGG